MAALFTIRCFAKTSTKTQNFARTLAGFTTCSSQKSAERTVSNSPRSPMYKSFSSQLGGAKSMSTMAHSDYIFRQLFDETSYTYSYILADKSTNDAIIIDPVIDKIDRDVQIIKELGLNLLYAANTHVHADHVTGSGEIKKHFPACKSIIGEPDAKADIHIKHGDIIKFGKFELECRSTPGHTNGCTTFVWHTHDIVFTGDALLVRGCGRTDFQQGDASVLYDSVHKQILSLPEPTLVYPAHDYKGNSVSSVGEEKTFNPRLTKSREEFVKIMDNLGLPYPKQIDKALPANMACGLY